jgi:hypothetical protein
MFDEVIGHIIFNNKTDLLFYIATWKKVMDGLSEFKTEKINPGEERLLDNSTTGEWHIELPFGDDFKTWEEKGLKSGTKPNEVYHQIGKFRSQSGISGKYVWINGTDIFLCEHSIDSETGMGMITISYNMDAPFFQNQGQNP